jgi:3-hydroxyacyl-[acyl-carrier-protein] dehydratase
MKGPVRALPTIVQPASEVDGEWTAVLEFEISPREPVFAGHYQDFPIFPGVCLVECVRLAVREVVPDSPAALVAVDTIRFHGPVFPHDVVTISLRWDTRRCDAQVTTGRGQAAAVRLRLSAGSTT